MLTKGRAGTAHERHGAGSYFADERWPDSWFVGMDETIGIVFPVYAWGAPMIVERFCESITLAPGAFAYAVCSCGDEAGKAMKRFKKTFAYQSAWLVVMPNNYIIGFDVEIAPP